MFKISDIPESLAPHDHGETPHGSSTVHLLLLSADGLCWWLAVMVEKLCRREEKWLTAQPAQSNKIFIHKLTTDNSTVLEFAH